MDDERICTECGGETAAEGQEWCSDCLEEGSAAWADPERADAAYRREAVQGVLARAFVAMSEADHDLAAWESEAWGSRQHAAWAAEHDERPGPGERARWAMAAARAAADGPEPADALG